MVCVGDINLASLHMQISKQELEEFFLHAKAKPVQKGIPNKQEERRSIHEQQPEDDSVSVYPSYATKADLLVDPLSGLEVTNHVNGNSSIVKTSKSLDDGEMIHSITKKVAFNNTVRDSSEDKSILDKLFGSSLTVNTSTILKEVILFLMSFA